MKKLVLILLIVTNVLFASGIESLLQEYENISDQSLKTVNEKLGHAVIYSQKELKLMQYNKLSDILKELPNTNLNKNKLGLSIPALAGSKSVSGFFRLFINDHEISSIYDQSFSVSWGDMPLDFIDHIEIYYGDSSFSLGNETGVYFLRLYTKSAKKENTNEIKTLVSENGSNSGSVTHSQTLENGWSYLLFLNNRKEKHKSYYNTSEIDDDEDRKYLYLDISNEYTRINFGYSDLKKDNYLGLSSDGISDSGSVKSKEFFIDFTKYFLDDKSLKVNASIDINERDYREQNAEGLGLFPVLDLTDMANTIPKELSSDLKFTKMKASVSKSIRYGNHNILSVLSVNNKKYNTQSRQTVNFFNLETDVGQYNDFDEETISSFLFQDDFRVNKNLILIGNLKFDNYTRSGYLDDFSQEVYRIGAIYTPFESFGLKSFYTKTYLPPSFNNIDFADKNNINIKLQKYEIYTLEAVYRTDNSKIGLLYNYVNIDDFLYLSPIGFTNIPERINAQGIVFDYEYNFSNKDKVHFNYFTTKQNTKVSNYQSGGYVKYMGSYKKIEYFTSLIYKESFRYYDIEVRDSFDLSVGATYNISKDLSCSIKGVNLLDKSTQSIHTAVFPVNNFAIDNYDRSVYLSMKWAF